MNQEGRLKREDFRLDRALIPCLDLGFEKKKGKARKKMKKAL